MGRALLAVASLLLISGCAEQPLAREDRSASKQIDVAKDEGATSDALKAARASLKFARQSESRATADLDGGRDDLKRGQDRQQAARAMAAEKRADSDAADQKVAAAQQEAVRADAHQADLRGKGIAEADVNSATLVEVSCAKQKVASTTSARDTVRLEIPLADLECEAAQNDIKSAETRIASATQRQDVARSLFKRSEQQAKSAEMETLAGKRTAIDGRLAPE